MDIPDLRKGACRKPTGSFCYDLSFDRAHRAANKLKLTAAAMPPAVAVSPPVTIPKAPSRATASRTPIASV